MFFPPNDFFFLFITFKLKQFFTGYVHLRLFNQVYSFFKYELNYLIFLRIENIVTILNQE